MLSLYFNHLIIKHGKSNRTEWENHGGCSIAMGARWYINGCMGDNHDDIWYIDDIYIWLYAIYGIVMVIIHDCHL